MMIKDRANKAWDLCGRLRGGAARARFVIGSRHYLSGDLRGARRWAEGPAGSGDGRCRLLLGLCLYDEICEDLSGEQGMEKLAAACRMMEGLERLEALDYRLEYLACMHLALVYRSAGACIKPPGIARDLEKARAFAARAAALPGMQGQNARRELMKYGRGRDGTLFYSGFSSSAPERQGPEDPPAGRLLWAEKGRSGRGD